MQNTLQLERIHSEAHAQQLNPETFNRWEACRSTHKFPAYQGKDLYIFTLENGLPNVEDVLTCEEVSLTLEYGFESTWVRENGKKIFVGHKPVEVIPGIFLWHTFFSEVQYTPYEGRYAVRVPLTYRCLHSITKVRVDGPAYILERAIYSSLFERS